MIQTTSEEHNKTILKRALKLALPDSIRPVENIKKSTSRTLTRRGVIWLGQTCNLHCYFCYFIDKIHDPTDPEHKFMPLWKAKKICKVLKDYYKNESIDIQGGEPTLYREIFELVSYCNEISLKPSLITNGLLLERYEICQRFKDSGVRDFLISIHGLGEVYDKIVGLSGAHVRQMKGINNLLRLGIPFRINCVLSKPVINQLPEIAEFTVKTGARIVNFIAFNPFEDQSKPLRRNADNVPKYSEISKILQDVIDFLEENDVEVNVRYLPFCFFDEEYRKNIYNFQQLPYDHYEWDLISWSWTGLKPQRTSVGDISRPSMPSISRTLISIKTPLKRLAQIKGLRTVLYNTYSLLSNIFSGEMDINDETVYRKLAKLYAESHCKYKYNKKCLHCSLKEICDGFHGDYAEIFGTDEAKPVKFNNYVEDPCYYISKQEKYILD